MGLPSIPYSRCLHCFGSAAAHSYFFHITHCPWVCYSLFLSFRALLSPFAFSMPIYLFHGPVIHYFCRLDLMVFFCSLSLANFSVLLSWASFLTFRFHKKRPSTFSLLNIWSALAAYMWTTDLPVLSTFLLSFPSRAFLNYRPLLIYIFLFQPWTVMTLWISQNGSCFKTEPPLHLFHSLLDGWPVTSLQVVINDPGI